MNPRAARSEFLIQARERHIVSNEPERGSAADIPCGKRESSLREATCRNEGNSWLAAAKSGGPVSSDGL